MTLLCIRTEAAKLRRSVIWLACLLLPIIPAIMGVFNYQSNLGILTNGWYSLWSQVTLFYSNFFMRLSLRSMPPISGAWST